MRLGKIAHLFFLGRAISRGPGYFARYAVRRAGRIALYRATRTRRRRD